ncbi:GH25 family lysozyme, partial [Lactiplantibacillus plantarum]
MSLNGFDVASYQAGMNVGEVAGDFVLVKATEGIDYTNPEFNGHAKQTLSAGKKLGVYHFIRNDSDIKQQADYFLTVVKPYIGKAMLVLDFENTTGSTIQNQAGVGLAKQWLDYVYQQTGVRSVLYTGISCENSLDWSSVVKANYGLWIAQYNNYNVVNGYQPRDLYGSL